MIRSLIEGFCELVFSDWSEEDRTWPPIAQKRIIGPGLHLPENLVKPVVDLPEVFRMDSRRIRNFQCVFPLSLHAPN